MAPANKSLILRSGLRVWIIRGALGLAFAAMLFGCASAPFWAGGSTPATVYLSCAIFAIFGLRVLYVSLQAFTESLTLSNGVLTRTFLLVFRCTMSLKEIETAIFFRATLRSVMLLRLAPFNDYRCWVVPIDKSHHIIKIDRSLYSETQNNMLKKFFGKKAEIMDQSSPEDIAKRLITISDERKG